MRRKGREKIPYISFKPGFYKKWKSSWEVFQPLFIVPKQTLMLFIYYKRSKKEKLQFWRKILKVDTHKVIFADPANFWHILPNWWFCLAKCSVSLHLTIDSFGNPLPSLEKGFEVLQSSDSSCDWSSTCLAIACTAIACTKISLNLGLFQWSKSYQKY